MKHLLRYIRQHLSLRLGLIITLIIAVGSSLLLDVLFHHCKQYIQRAAIDHATQLLDNTAVRISGIMDETDSLTEQSFPKLKRLSDAVTRLKPYPNSSAIMLGHDGTYLVHPDTAKLFRESIFSDAAPEAQQDIDKLGHAMLAGRSGMIETIVDNRNAFIFYRPLEHTAWSIAIVCPESDVFARYNHMLAIVWTIICVGLLLLLIVCYLIVRRAIQPLEQLDYEAQRIAEGHFDTALIESPRQDSVGRLQNSFIRMQQSLATSVNDILSVNAELEQRNEELTQAYQQQLKTNHEKTAFIQKMYHEIRTPLNIIGGFTQVLSVSIPDLPAEEIADITSRISESAADITRLAHDLDKAADLN